MRMGRIHYFVDRMMYMNFNGFQNNGPLTEVEVLACSSSTEPAELYNDVFTGGAEPSITPPVPCVPPPPKPITSAILGKCGTLLDYDPIYGRTDPELYGVR